MGLKNRRADAHDPIALLVARALPQPTTAFWIDNDIGLYSFFDWNVFRYLFHANNSRLPCNTSQRLGSRCIR